MGMLPTMLANHMAKKLKHDMEAGIKWGFIRHGDSDFIFSFCEFLGFWVLFFGGTHCINGEDSNVALLPQDFQSSFMFTFVGPLRVFQVHAPGHRHCFRELSHSLD